MPQPRKLISTGSAAIDRILGGGVSVGEVMEVRVHRAARAGGEALTAAAACPVLRPARHRENANRDTGGTGGNLLAARGFSTRAA